MYIASWLLWSLRRQLLSATSRRISLNVGTAPTSSWKCRLLLQARHARARKSSLQSPHVHWWEPYWHSLAVSVDACREAPLSEWRFYEELVYNRGCLPHHPNPLQQPEILRSRERVGVGAIGAVVNADIVQELCRQRRLWCIGGRLGWPLYRATKHCLSWPACSITEG